MLLMEHVAVGDYIQLLFRPWKANSSLAAVQRFSPKWVLPRATEIAEETSVNNILFFKLKFEEVETAQRSLLKSYT